MMGWTTARPRGQALVEFAIVLPVFMLLLFGLVDGGRLVIEYSTLTTPIVFFDGDDAVQTRWVRAFLGDAPDRYVPLMTNGPVVELMQQWNVRLYFDQHGRYAEQFGVRALPAVVRQEGLLLRIDEIALEQS